jgi:hypothetical protein
VAVVVAIYGKDLTHRQLQVQLAWIRAALNDRTYAVTFQSRFLACGSEVPHHFCGSFFALRGEKRPTTEEKEHSAEG